MALRDDLENQVSNIINTKWNVRNGTVFPDTEDVALNGGTVKLEATYLYTDMANSSKMAKELDRRVVAKILKSFLGTSARLIRARNGKIVSFDGDRVLGVFWGGYKNTNAAKCALNIAWTVSKVIRKKFEDNYESVKDANFSISHGTGIDTGEVLVVRTGIRGANDLISIGRSPNLAAKMSDLRSGDYKTYISSSVYNRLNDEAKYAGDPKKDMWESRIWEFLGENISVYRSNYTWKP